MKQENNTDRDCGGDRMSYIIIQNYIAIGTKCLMRKTDSCVSHVYIML